MRRIRQHHPARLDRARPAGGRSCGTTHDDRFPFLANTDRPLSSLFSPHLRWWSGVRNSTIPDFSPRSSSFVDKFLSNKWWKRFVLDGLLLLFFFYRDMKNSTFSGFWMDIFNANCGIFKMKLISLDVLGGTRIIESNRDP